MVTALARRLSVSSRRAPTESNSVRRRAVKLRTRPEVAAPDIEAARRSLAGVISPTPIFKSTALSKLIGAEAFFKAENLQKTGSFKIRGAYNFVASLSKDGAARGVIAASAGNHGQALAYAASQARIKATIVMPQSASISKIAATQSYGQRLVLEGADYQAARRAAERLRDESGAIFVDAYDDARVIAGQGTVGTEIAHELKPDFVMVPVGGGGLLAGICVALDARSPKTKIIGVEASGSPQLSLSLKRRSASSIGRPAETIADGLATGKLGELPFDLIRNRLDDVVAVDDFEIGEAVLLMLERMKLLSEGAGAAALAGAIKIRKRLRGKRVVLCISGGNIDINLLDRIIGHGLVKAGRLFRFSIELRDRPGELSKLLALVGQLGANVHAVLHDRTRRHVAISAAQVMLELETRGPDHVAAVRSALRKNGYAFSDERG
jgi:threonine dehydratase